MIKKYKKKPIIVEAILFNGLNSQEIENWIGKPIIKQKFSNEIVALEIPTLEGTMVASVGDYIIKGIKEEFYPCKPEIFEQTYEEEEQDEI